MIFFREPVNPLYGISRVEYQSDRPFNPDRVKGNTYPCGEATLVRIPKIEGRISIRKQDNKTYVEYIYESGYDPETQQNRNRKKIIGRVFGYYTGFMLPNDNYFQFFDMNTGELLPQPAEEENNNEAEEASDQAKEPIEQADTTDETPDTITEPVEETLSTEHTAPTEEETNDSSTNEDADNHPISDQSNETTMPMKNNPIKQASAQGRKELINMIKTLEEQKRQEEERKARQEAIAAQDEEAIERERYIAFKDHFELVRAIYDEAYDTIQKQARKSPNTVVSLYTVQRINETIAEIQDMMKDTEITNYIVLLDEPKEEASDSEETENKTISVSGKTAKAGKTKRSGKAESPRLTGLTFSDVEIIMGQIHRVLSWYSNNRIKHTIY